MSGTSLGGGDSPLVRLGLAVAATAVGDEEDEDGDRRRPLRRGFVASTASALVDVDALARLFLNASGGSGREADSRDEEGVVGPTVALFIEGSTALAESPDDRGLKVDRVDGCAEGRMSRSAPDPDADDDMDDPDAAADAVDPGPFWRLLMRLSSLLSASADMTLLVVVVVVVAG